MYQSESSTTNDPAGAVTCVVHACVLVLYCLADWHVEGLGFDRLVPCLFRWT